MLGIEPGIEGELGGLGKPADGDELEDVLGILGDEEDDEEDDEEGGDDEDD